ncbi:MAG: DUF3467 domain-containing protein [Terriglobales bacterium]
MDEVFTCDEPDDVEAKYANCFRVGYNTFEFFIDFGQVTEGKRARVHTRIISNPDSAKALQIALQQSLAEYESSFGVTNPSKAEPN